MNMNNKEFTELLRQNFEKESQNSFLKKFKMVDVVEEELTPEPSSQLVIADVVSGKSDTEGKFEFVSTQYPHIKTGCTIRDHKDETLIQAAEDLTKGTINRVNELISLFIQGGGQASSIILKTETQKDINYTVKSSLNNLKDIKERVSYMKDTYGVTYNRITLNGVLLTLLTGEMKVEQAKKILKEATGLKVDVDNGYYNQKNSASSKVQIDYVPKDTVIISNSKNDNSDLFYFANLPVTVSNEIDIFGMYGIVGYLEDETAFAMIRGVPVIRDKTAFATIKFTYDK